MANWMHSGLALVLAAVESTEGTDAIEAAPGTGIPADLSQAVYVRSITMNPEWNEVDLQRKRDTYAMTGKLPGKMYWSIELELPLASSPPTTGTDIAEPEVIRFLKCAGFKVATSGTPLDTYEISPDSRGAQETLTLYMITFKDGTTPGSDCVEIRRAVACKFGGVELTNSPDGESFWKMSGMGLWQADDTPGTHNLDIITNISMTAFDALGIPEFVHPVDAVVPKSCLLQVPTATDVKPTANFSCSWDSSVESRDDITSTFGCAGFFVQPGVPTITIDPEFELTSSLNRYESVYDVEDLTLAASITTVNGGVWTFSAPNLQRGAFSFEEGAGTLRVSQALYPRDTAYDGVGGGAGDDSLVLTFQQDT